MHVARIATADRRRGDLLFLLVIIESHVHDNKMERKPPAIVNDVIVLSMGVYRGADNSGRSLRFLHPALPTGTIQYAGYDMYICGNRFYLPDDLGLGMFMPIGCIVLRLLEKIYNRRWYTILPERKDFMWAHYDQNEMQSAVTEYLRDNIYIMKYMWRVLPQPIAEEICEYFFW
jgi:hypothetical protein